MNLFKVRCGFPQRYFFCSSFAGFKLNPASAVLEL